MSNYEQSKRADEQGLQNINDKLNAGTAQKSKGNSTPYYATGARCFIKMAGKAVGISQDFNWTVGYNSTPIMTVDSVFPWDIDVGQVNIGATLSKILNPLKGPEAENLFPIMAAAVHQPMVELQVIYQARYVTQTGNANIDPRISKSDIVDFSMFFARGMFTSVSGNATLGSLSGLSATFTGVAYQHYVSQAFVPYGLAYEAQEAIADIQDLAGSLTGGFA